MRGIVKHRRSASVVRMICYLAPKALFRYTVRQGRFSRGAAVGTRLFLAPGNSTISSGYQALLREPLGLFSRVIAWNVHHAVRFDLDLNNPPLRYTGRLLW
jgi:hypothetical protein